MAPKIPPLLPHQMSAEEIAKLIEPVIDIASCERISITNLKLNHKSVVSKIYGSGSPVLLNVHGHTLLLCDPQVYLDLENRRQWVLQGCKSTEELIQTGKVNLPDEKLQKLAHLKFEIEDAKREVKELKRNQARAAKRLATIQAEAESLSLVLKGEG